MNNMPTDTSEKGLETRIVENITKLNNYKQEVSDDFN